MLLTTTNTDDDDDDNDDISENSINYVAWPARPYCCVCSIIIKQVLSESLCAVVFERKQSCGDISSVHINV